MSKTPGPLVSRGSWMARQLCTDAEAGSAAREKRKGLFTRLSALGEKGGSVKKTLDEFKLEVRRVRNRNLVVCAKQLRKYRRFRDALEIMEWMENKEMTFSPGDCAVHLDLIAKAKGVSAAENYFSGLSPTAQNHLTYGALLNCYCTERMPDKAHALFDKMDTMKFLSTSLPFDSLMSLHIKLGQPEYVPAIVQKMIKKGISPGTFTYNTLMQSYGCFKDFEGIERVLDEMKRIELSWTTYSNLAVIYVKAGLFERAESALKKLEEWMTVGQGREPYHFLISQYANTSNQGEVNRVWNSMKSAFHTTPNISYLVMLQALAKLKDVEGVLKCFSEWDSSSGSYDMRLANVAIRACLEHDLHEEAALIFDDALKRFKGLFFKAREMFMVFFLKKRQLDFALKHMEAAFAEVKENNWKAEQTTVIAFFNYFEEEKDVDSIEKLCKRLKQINCLNSNTYSFLLKTGKLAPDMRQKLEEDGIEMNPELENLLERVCPK